MTSTSGRSLNRRQLLVGAGAAAVLSACSSGDSRGAGGSGGSGGNAESITLDSDNPTWADGFTKAGVALKGITGSAVKPISVPTTENYQQVVRTALKTPKTADVVKWWSGYRLQDLARTNLLTDLSSTWSDLESKKYVDPALKAPMSSGGKVYGIPVAQSFWVFFYSKKVFAQYGLTAPTTWAQFMSTSATLKSHGVIPAVATQNGTWPSFIWFQEILSKLDPDFYVKLGNNQASYTDPTAVKAMEIWKGFYDRGWFTKPDFDPNNGPPMIKSGKLGMMPYGTWGNGQFAQSGMKSGVDYDAFVLPPVTASTKPSVIVESTALVLPTKAPQHSAAQKTLQHWLDPKVQSVWSGFLQDNSANPSVVSTDPVIRSIKATVKSRNLTQLQRYWEASPPNLVEENVQSLASFMINPSTYQAVLAKMAAASKTEWSSWTSSS